MGRFLWDVIKAVAPLVIGVGVLLAVYAALNV